MLLKFLSRMLLNFFLCHWLQHQYPRISFLDQSFLMETVDSSGAMISSLEYGITIIIPPGAIPVVTQIQVQVLCCFGGPFVLPKGYYLCSPVYIISPSFHFLKDVELWMVHHAYLSDPEDCSQMMFVTDAPSLETLDQGQPEEYHLRPIQGGRFSVHGVVGKVSLKWFGKKAIAAKIFTDGVTTPQKKIQGTIYMGGCRCRLSLYYGVHDLLSSVHMHRPLHTPDLYPSVTLPTAAACGLHYCTVYPTLLEGTYLNSTDAASSAVNLSFLWY